MAPTWQDRAAAKRTSILSHIPEPWRLNKSDLEEASRQTNLTGPFIQKFLDAETISIVSQDSVALVSSLREGFLTAVQVTTAFCRTAAVAHQINNCLHEIFFDQALERAKWLDEYYSSPHDHAANGDDAEKEGRSERRTVGPLHGLPVSLKDQFHVKGVDTTMGYVGWIGGNLGLSEKKTHLTESQIVEELLGLGAVVYCKTSLPQTLHFGETVNNIIGSTLNPQNMRLSCGGSSGGEGALQALRGSTLGVGTDIGGSVRIPAAFNGIFSLKPTPERVSYKNVANTNPGQTTYRSTVGFLSTSLGGLKLILESILSTEPWLRDPAVVPMTFRHDIFDATLARADTATGAAAKTGKRPLKLGVLWSDGIIGLHPPVRRGMEMVVDAVRSAGHEVVDWNPPSHATAIDIHVSFLHADGAHDIHTHISRSGEPLVPQLSKSFSLRTPDPLLACQDRTLRGLAFEQEYSDYWNSSGTIASSSPRKVSRPSAEDGKGEDKEKIVAMVDAVIMPVAPHAAVIPGKYYHTGYTEAINLLNYSVAVIPVTKAQEDIDLFDSSYVPLNEKDRMNWEAYDPKIYHGGPVGVQLVGRKFEEEKVLAVAHIVYAALQKNTRECQTE